MSELQIAEPPSRTEFSPSELVYSIEDKLGGTFSAPFLSQNDKTAKRMFEAACLDGASIMSKNPEDFRLIRIGQWDSNTGIFRATETEPVPYGNEG